MTSVLTVSYGRALSCVCLSVPRLLPDCYYCDRHHDLSVSVAVYGPYNLGPCDLLYEFGLGASLVLEEDISACPRVQIGWVYLHV